MKVTWILSVLVLVIIASSHADYGSRHSDRDRSRYSDRDGSRYSDRDGSRYSDRDGSRYSDRDGSRYSDRDGSWNSHRSGRHSKYRPKNYHYRKNTSKVIMPSGANATIIKPREAKYVCTKVSDLVTMSATDEKWKDEYAIVKQEVENTNKSPGLIFNIIKIEKIFNSCLWRQYSYRRDVVYEDAQKTNERMLFHGSLVAGDLALTGFDERYANLGGFFGAGIYFADRSSKSHGYARPQPDGTRRMLLCRVTLGNEQRLVGKPTQLAHAPIGFQSVVGSPSILSDTEYIVYRADQAYPAFLITYK